MKDEVEHGLQRLRQERQAEQDGAARRLQDEQAHAEEKFNAGMDYGRTWAILDAHYVALAAVAGTTVTQDGAGYLLWSGPGAGQVRDGVGQMLRPGSPAIDPPFHTARGFIEGAKDVFNRI